MARSQSSFRVRTEWGPQGAAMCLSGAGTAVVVDVLSFTTTTVLAVSRGVEVFPFRWRDVRLQEFATSHDAEIAAGRIEARATGSLSLSPESVVLAPEEDLPQRVVMPSPNGATISESLRDAGAEVLLASLSNADAVGAELARRLAEEPDSAVLVVPSGERWTDGSLRPAVEDLWGAGAVLSALRAHATIDLTGLFSPEALVAEGGFLAVKDNLLQWMMHCSSGRELVASDYASDVAIAAEFNVSTVIPVLRGDRFVELGAPESGSPQSAPAEPGPDAPPPAAGPVTP